MCELFVVENDHQLWRMINAGHACRWTTGGEAFIVEDLDVFESQVLPGAFKCHFVVLKTSTFRLASLALEFVRILQAKFPPRQALGTVVGPGCH
jgi:hypothetical protein